MRSTVSDWAMALCLTNERLKHTYQAHCLSSEAFTLWPDSHETRFQMIDQPPYTSYLTKVSNPIDNRSAARMKWMIANTLSLYIIPVTV
ncbi:hypothetical protein TOC8171_45580 [Pseudomonas syringae]